MSTGDGRGPHGGSLADNIVSSALRYRAQAPFVDNLLKEIGMSPNEITNLGNLLREEGDGKSSAKDRSSAEEPTKKKKR